MGDDIGGEPPGAADMTASGGGSGVFRDVLHRTTVSSIGLETPPVYTRYAGGCPLGGVNTTHRDPCTACPLCGSKSTFDDVVACGSYASRCGDAWRVKDGERYTDSWSYTKRDALLEWKRLKSIPVSEGSGSWSVAWTTGCQERYRVPVAVEKHLPPFLSWHVYVRRKVGLSLDLLPTGVRSYVLRVFQIVGVWSGDEGHGMAVLKELGTWSKRYGPEALGPYWAYFVDWNLLFGNHPSPGADEVVDQARGWFGDKVPKGWTRRKWYELQRIWHLGLDRLEVMVEAQLASSGISNEDRIPYSDWEKWPGRWVTSGSSGGVASSFSSVRSSKKACWLGGVSESSKSWNGGVFVIKREFAKPRGVLSSSYNVYRDESWLFQGLEDMVEKFVPTSLGGCDRERWDSIASHVSGYVGCFDVSQFDKLPGDGVVERGLRLLSRITAPRSGGDELYVEVREKVISSLLKQVVKIPGHGPMTRVRGVLSGWRCTAALDTYLNYALWTGIAVEAGVSDGLKGIRLFQGDDVVIAGVGKSILSVLAFVLDRLPELAHPSKGWIGRSRFEFLRYVCTSGPGGCYRSGYPLRVVPRIVSSSPWTGGVFSPRSALDSWSLLVARGMAIGPVVRHCVRDLCGCIGCTAGDVHKYLHTPATVGGGGWFPSFDYRQWIVLRSASLFEAGERRLRTTEFSSLSSSDQVLVKGRLSALFGSKLGGGLVGVCDSLVSGLELKRPVDNAEKARLVRFQVPDVSGFGFVLQKTPRLSRPPPPPRLNCDPSVFRPYLVLKCRTQEWDVVASLLKHSNDVKMIQSFRSKWPRSVWYSWLSGDLSGLAPLNRLGYGADALSKVEPILRSQWWPVFGSHKKWRLDCLKIRAEVLAASAIRRMKYRVFRS